MNTDTTRQIDSTSSSVTEQLAEKLGQRLRGGEVIELTSDLGGGKTTFVRGLARGAGSPDRVASPTFTISKIYQTNKFAIHHFDFYRLADAGLMEHELQDILNDPGIVTLVEWGKVVRHVLPADRLTIKFFRTGDESRQLELTYPESLQYLVETL
jgi:tRNA threonylcarbamoyladenosine biosynthesis protein TsaE